jgi:hypothetical protein
MKFLGIVELCSAHIDYVIDAVCAATADDLLRAADSAIP